MIDQSRHYVSRCFHVFFFNDTATTEIYTLSLHDALPISAASLRAGAPALGRGLRTRALRPPRRRRDRKSTRLNSSHLGISYAVFCLKKKKKKMKTHIMKKYHKRYTHRSRYYTVTD